MTSRETFLNINDQTVAAPGPGHYDPGFAQDVIVVSIVVSGQYDIDKKKKKKISRNYC